MLPGRTKLVGLSDSAFRPPKDGMNLSLTRLCLSQGACTADDQNKWIYEHGAYLVWGEQNGSDTTCLPFHPNDPWKCADSHHILMNHVNTPFFVRMAELDPAGLSDYQDDGIFIDNGADTNHPISNDEFAAAVRADIRSLALLPITSEEHVPFIPGAFSPTCSQHDVLRSDRDVYGTFIRRHGDRLTLFDVFLSWVHGNNLSIVAGAADGSDSHCPQ